MASSPETDKFVDTTNVSYIDEYPHLSEKIRLRRLAQRKLGEVVTPKLIILPTPINMGDFYD